MTGARQIETACGKGNARQALRRSCVRLRRDDGGNTLGIAAISLVLLLAAVGAGVDMSRAYMTKTNLQAACDSGVLAGRRALSKTGTYGTDEKAKASKMFNFNMHASQTQSKNVSFETVSHDDGSVTGTASATMPTAIMSLFDLGDMTLNVDCSAELQMASADVMFVLDVTGSMAGTKIQGLRDAVREFHKTVAAAVINKDETVIRYGFVPYSMTVNASALTAANVPEGWVQMPASWFADQTLYQTRVAVFDTTYYRANSPTAGGTTEETYGSAISSSNCTNYGKNTYPSGSGGTPVAGGGPAPTATTSTAYSYKSWTKTGKSGNTDIGTCKRNKQVTTTTYNPTPVYQFSKWRHKAATVDTSGLVVNGSRQLIKTLATTNYVPTQGEYDMRALAKLYNTADTSLPAPSSYAWSGCLEERATVVNYAMNPVPDGAKDLNINEQPVDADNGTKWKPYWGTMEYNRGTTATVDGGSYSSLTEYCPAPMREFTEVDTHDATTVPSWLDTYLNNLVAVGGTYHDIGMIWGARLASTRGMFAENVLDGDRNSVSRHVIFMTDGVMEPSSGSYNAYGIEDIDHRIAPSGSGSGANSVLSNYHTNRFLAACQKAKEEGYTIWVISFGTAITTAMKTCSSGERAYFASNTTELKNAFRYIAGQVADLRINK